MIIGFTIGEDVLGFEDYAKEFIASKLLAVPTDVDDMLKVRNYIYHVQEPCTQEELDALSFSTVAIELADGQDYYFNIAGGKLEIPVGFITVGQKVVVNFQRIDASHIFQTSDVEIRAMLEEFVTRKLLAHKTVSQSNFLPSLLKENGEYILQENNGYIYL